jgi:hypothetical protein
VVAGWPGSVHDMRVFNDALEKYRGKFLFPPKGMQLPLSLSFVILDKLCMKLIHKYSCVGKYYLVDFGYPNKPGYLAPYKSTKYHVLEWREGPGSVGQKEVFNFNHSSLRNVIERSFGVLKTKWCILLDLPSFPVDKQSKIIMACMELHNFIRQSGMMDDLFHLCDEDENYDPNDEETVGTSTRT